MPAETSTEKCFYIELYSMENEVDATVDNAESKSNSDWGNLKVNYYETS